MPAPTEASCEAKHDAVNHRLERVEDRVSTIADRIALLEGKVIAASAVGASVGSLVVGAILLFVQFYLTKGGN